MATIDKKDWELWVLALAMLGILTAGFFFLLLPPVFLSQPTMVVSARISPQLLLGLLLLMMMFLVYLVHKQIYIRSLRMQSISEAWNFGISHIQSLVDPLTQALNRAAFEEILSKEVKRVQRKQATLIFLYVEVNHFKEAKTRYGHLS